MQVRDNVRERRRERIARLVERQEVQSAPSPGREQQSKDSLAVDAREETPAFSELEAPPADSRGELVRPDNSSSDPDPELWWREREKRLKTGQALGWEGLKSLPPTSDGGGGGSGGVHSDRFLRGVGVRLVIAALAFAGFWAWMKLELPGSGPAKEWMVESVSRDMDFRAIEAWYGDTFGGSPSFLTFGRQEPDTLEVAALLDPTATSVPVRGTIVQTFADNGKGVQVAAQGDSEVFAVFTGKVQQVTRDDKSGVTILVQHQNRVLTVYGGLAEAIVKPNEWVQTGQAIGRLGPAASDQSEAVLSFSVQHDGKAIDPAEVVGLD